KDLGAAGRTAGRRREGGSSLRPRVEVCCDDLRDDLAGLLDLHEVADAHVLAGELDEVVQRGPADRGAREEDGLEVGDGGELARLADRDGDLEQAALLALGCELVSDAP